MPSTEIQIPILSWLDKPIKQAFESVFDGLNASTEALDLFNKFRKNHLKALHSKVENIKVLGMSCPVKLVDIYSPLFISSTIHNRLYDRTWDSIEDITTKIIEKKTSDTDECRADDFIESKDRVVVLGGAGSGKTTLLRYLALAYSKKEVFEATKLETPKIPFYISMYEYSNNDTPVFDYIANQLIATTDKYAKDYLDRIFKKGHSIIFFDALDEVPIRIRDKYVDYIKRFSNTYTACKVVITCRTADFTANLENFFEVELVRLKQPAVAKIIRAWFKEEPKKAKRLLQLLRREKDVQSLTETPLLLSLLCIQFRHDLTLPKRKTELYERCINAFLRDWDTGRGFRRDSSYSMLSDETKESIFQQVAGTYSQDQIQYTFPEREIHNLIGIYCERFGCVKHDGKNILNEIERHHGIIERYSRDYYTFSHPSFQEYFSARYFINDRSEFDKVKINFDNDQWANIIEFIVSMQYKPENILYFLKEQSAMNKLLKQYPAMATRTRRLWLLYRCISVAHYLKNKDRQVLYKHIFDSQIQMARIYGEGGVNPVAVLMHDGVHHAYFYTKKRPTLRDALQPYRMFSNEFLFNPSEIYANIVIDQLEKSGFLGKDKKDTKDYSVALSLMVPLASIRPDEVKVLLNLLIKGSDSNISYLANESKLTLENNSPLA